MAKLPNSAMYLGFEPTHFRKATLGERQRESGEKWKFELGIANKERERNRYETTKGMNEWMRMNRGREKTIIKMTKTVMATTATRTTRKKNKIKECAMWHVFLTYSYVYMYMYMC